jgi:subtilase family serine protease
VLLVACGDGSVVLTPPLEKVDGNSRTLAVPLGPRSIVPGKGLTFALCAASKDPMRASCLGTVRMMSSTTSAYPDSAEGLTPSDLASIYGYSAPADQSSTSEVIGIVVAYDNAAAESDLATYRSYFNLPACTTANGCFEKLGASQTRTADIRRAPLSVSANPTTTISGWAAEADADIEAASAVCANCKIVLSEAATDNLSDLANAVSAAVSAGATVVNASFGAPEDASQSSLESAFEPAPVKVVAAAGDSAGDVLFPASATNVISVSGTTLNVSGSSVSQSLWSGSGGGCSAVFAAPSYQPGWCSNRSVADIAAVADPNTGLAFYDSAVGGWEIVGGTSISAPIVVGMFALSGDTSSGSGAQRLYAHRRQYLQVSGAGNLDGLGTPKSLSAF